VPILQRHYLLIPFLMLLPSFLLVAWIIGAPAVDLVVMATHSVSRFGQVGRFVAGLNFAMLFSDPLFWQSAWRTILWTVCLTFGTICLSIPISIALSQEFFGRSIARTIILLPWAMSVTMSSIVWRWTLNGQYGMLDTLLGKLGLIRSPIDFLATAPVAFPIAILIGILSAIPLTVIIFLGGFSSLPSDVFDAARVDGATPFRVFLHMTLPLIRPFVNIAVVLNVIYAFNSFAIIWVLTEGGPANGTDILVTYLYKIAFQYGKLGEAAAMSLVMFAFVSVCCVVYAKSAMRDDLA
jgi:multiple sugar transport system permease protein